MATTAAVIVEGSADDISAFIPQFREEMHDRVQQLKGLLLKLEGDRASEELIAAIFREAHTIKGLANAIGQENTSLLSHWIEDVLDAARNRTSELRPQSFDVFFSVLQLLRTSIDGAAPAAAMADVEAQVKNLLEGETATPVVPDSSTRAVPGAIGSGLNRRGAVMPPREDLLRMSGQELDALAALAQEVVDRRLQEQKSLRNVRPLLSNLAHLEHDLEHISQQVQRDEANPAVRSSLLQLQTRFREIEGGLQGFLDVREQSLVQERRELEEFSAAIQQIQSAPLAVLFEAFPRVVRDMAQEQGKEVELRVVGEQTRLARSLFQQVRAPLVHLLQNAVVHGIETPEEREALGKDRVGFIKVDAYPLGEKIFIEVSDDGAGINPEELREKARAEEILGREEDRDDEEVLGLIFRSGFTTRGEVTGTSGRGVGLDLVRSRLTSVGGLVWVVSQPGSGTTFVLELPAGQEGKGGVG